MSKEIHRTLAIIGFAFIFLVALMAAAAMPAYGQSVVYNSTAPVLTNGQRTDQQADASGNLKVVMGTTGTSASQVQGNVASAVADSGNPVKIGGKYNSTLPTFTNGQRGDAQIGVTGSLNVTLMQPDSVNAIATQFDNQDAQVPGSQSNKVLVVTRPTIYDGANWNLQRGDLNGMVVQPALSSTFWRYAAAASGIVSSTADVAVKAASGGTPRNYVCSIDISHDLLSAASEIVIKDGATVMWRGKLQTAASDVSVGAGKLTFTPCLQGTANTATNVAMISSVTGGVYVNLTGYTGS